MIGSLAPLVLLALPAAPSVPLVVVEARLPGTPGHTALGAELAAAAHAPSPRQAAAALQARLGERLPTASAEAVAEASRRVEQGCAAFRAGDAHAAVALLDPALHVLDHAVAAEADDERLFQAALCRALALAVEQPGSEEARAALRAAADRFGEERQHRVLSEFGFAPLQAWLAALKELPPTSARLLVRPAALAAWDPTLDRAPPDPSTPTQVFLDGRHLGAAPVEREVRPGRHLVYVTLAGRPGTLRAVEIAPGGTVDFDPSGDFEPAVQTEGELALLVAAPPERDARLLVPAAWLARRLDAPGAAVYWLDGPRVHIALVGRDGQLRAELDVNAIEAPSELAARLHLLDERGAAHIDYRLPGVGRLALLVESVGAPQRVGLSLAWPGAPQPAPADLCVTPCTLFVPRGRATIHSGGDGLRAGIADVDVREPLRIRMYAPSARVHRAGVGLLIASGVSMLAALAVAGGAAAVPDDRIDPLLFTAGGLAASSFVALLTGVVMILVSQPGVARSEPLGAGPPP
jgi:hypothetical protein